MSSAAPALANVVQYNFTIDGCSSGGCGLSNYGKVTVSDLGGGGVNVAFDLTSTGSGFIDSGALNFDTVYFNLSGTLPTSAQITGLPASFTAASGSFAANGGFGTFDYKVDCNSACGPSDPYYTPWGFNFTLSSVTTASFIMGTGTTNNAYFVADISNPNGGNPLTGRIGATIGTTTTNVPEPMTLSLFGAGLAGATMLRRKKKTA